MANSNAPAKPIRNPIAEVVIGNNYARKSNGEFFYPKDVSGNEYVNKDLYYIQHGNQFIYPLNVKGTPNYRIKNGKQIYETVNGKQVIGVDSDGSERYAIDENGNEYYTKDNTPAKMSDGTPYYAQAYDKKDIFPIDSQGNEYYIARIDLSKPLTIPKRYAKSAFGDEIYPLKLTIDNNESQYLINNKYAVDKNNKRFYPKDGFKNEFYRTPSTVDINDFRRNGSVDQILLDRYALTNDGKIILIKINTFLIIKPYLKPTVLDNNIIGRLIREGDEVSDYLTNVSDPTFKPSYVIPYRYKTIITKEIHTVVPKQIIQSNTLKLIGIFNTSLPFYRRWCFWILLILIAIIKGFFIWWFYFKNTIQNS